MGKIKILDYTCGLVITIVGLGLYSYYVRELLASLLLFSAAFAGMASIVLTGVLAWYTSKQVAQWSRLAPRSVTALPVGEGAASLVDEKLRNRTSRATRISEGLQTCNWLRLQ